MRQDEKRLQTLLDEIADGVVVAVDGKNYWVNRRMEELTGYTAQELIGKGPDLLVVPEQIDEFVKRMKERQAGQPVPRHYETIIARKDGKRLNIDVKVRKTVFDNKDAWAIVVRDITERVEVENALEESERRFSNLVENAPVGVYSTDFDGNFLYANEALVKILDCDSSADLMARNVKQFYKHLSNREELIKNLKEHGKIGNFELAIVTSRGRDKTALLSANLENNVLSGMLLDITERIRTEEELKKSQEELRNLSIHQEKIREAERTRISRELHDELGQGLTALKLNLAMAREAQSMDPDEADRKIRGMLDLVDNTISTVRRLCLELRPGVLDEIGLTAAIEWQVEEFEKNTGLACELTVSPEIADIGGELSTTVFRIFQEALTNVARHAEASSVKVVLQKESDSVMLSVEDDGRGIQEDSFRSRGSFGLIGMRERAHSSGGRLAIESTPEQGTVIRLILPVEKS